MGNDTLKKTTIAIMMITLFSVIILTFVIGVGNQYGKDTSELTGDKFNVTGLNSSVNNLQSTAEEWKDSFTEGNIFKVIGLTVMGIFSTAVNIFEFIITPFTLLLQITNNVLKIPTVVTGVVIAIFIVIIIFGIWSVWKKGD